MEVLSSRVLYHAKSLEVMRHFYEQTLGVALYREYGTGGRVIGVVYFLGGGFLEVSSGPPPSAPFCLWLQVRDVAAEESRLRAQRVEVLKPTELMPWGLVECWIGDPEGNELRLIEVPDDHPLRRRL